MKEEIQFRLPNYDYSFFFLSRALENLTAQTWARCNAFLSQSQVISLEQAISEKEEKESHAHMIQEEENSVTRAPPHLS